MRKKRGFTLIEVLVVVAIIALLISIAMPSLRAARRASRKTVCLTNLKQIGTAVGMYLPGNRDTFPFIDRLPSQLPPPGDPQWPGMAKVFEKELGGGRNTSNEKGAATEALLCPSDEVEEGDIGDPPYKERYFDTEQTSYAWETGINGKRVINNKVEYGDTGLPLFNQPASEVFIVSDYRGWWHASPSQTSASNRLFADWHVEPNQ